MNEERRLQRVPFQAMSLTLALSVLFLSTGCQAGIRRPDAVTLPRLLEPARRPDPTHIEPIVAGGKSRFSMSGYSHGRGKGAAIGAGGALGSWFGSSSGTRCGMCAAALVLFAPLVAVGGAIAGAAHAVSKKDVKKMNDVLEKTTSGWSVEHGIVEELRAALGTGVAVDAVLEIGPVTIVGFGHGGNTPVRWHVSADAKLRRNDGKILQSGSYTFHGRARKLGEWVRGDLAPLRAELQRASHSLAEKIGDEFLRLDPIRRRAALQVPAWSGKGRSEKPRADDPPDSFYGLRPIQPPTLGPYYKTRSNGLPRYAFTRVPDGPLTFRWEAFEPVGPDADRVRNVTYEIRVARAEGSVPSVVVYRRAGLTEPEFTVQRGLPHGLEYFWTVRAHFEVDGDTRVTEWGGIHSRSRLAAEVPNVHSYRFKVGR